MSSLLEKAKNMRVFFPFFMGSSVQSTLLRKFLPIALIVICSNALFLLLFVSYFGLHVPYIIVFSGILLLGAGLVNFFVVNEIAKSIGGKLDVTLKEKNDANDQLLEQKLFYEGILNRIPVDVAVYDEHFRYVYCNPNTIPDENERKWIIGKTDEDYCLKKDLDIQISKERNLLFQKAVKKKFAISIEQDYKDEKGNLKYTLRTIMPGVAYETDKDGFKSTSSRYISFGFDITQLKLHEETLKVKNRELEKTNFELDRFVYSASHDLKAPLSSVLGLINLSKKESKDADQLLYLGMMEKSISKLNKFIKDLINYSRNTRIEVKSEPVHFENLINEQLENLKYMENLNKLNIEMQIEKNDFWSDEHRISTILNNLIANSVMYHNRNSVNPWIKIHTMVTEEEATIIIMDNGIGIEKEHIGNIYDMFYRATEQSQGSGLGLYIVKELIDKLNGSIQVKSVPGKGTEFRVVLPNLKNKMAMVRNSSLKAVS